MSKSNRIVFVLTYLISVFLLFGCSENNTVETDSDFERETNEYVDLYKPDISGMFDSVDDVIPDTSNSVVVYKAQNDTSGDSDVHKADINEAVYFDNSKEIETDTTSDDNESGSVTSYDAVRVPDIDKGDIQQHNSLSDESTKAEVNADKSDNDISVEFDNAAYILNTNTKKFHYPYCGSVKQIKEKNKGAGNNRDGIIAQGYQPCKRCNP